MKKRRTKPTLRTRRAEFRRALPYIVRTLEIYVKYATAEQAALLNHAFDDWLIRRVGLLEATRMKLAR